MWNIDLARFRVVGAQLCIGATCARLILCAVPLRAVGRAGLQHHAGGQGQGGPEEGRKGASGSFEVFTATHAMLTAV